MSPTLKKHSVLLRLLPFVSLIAIIVLWNMFFGTLSVWAALLGVGGGLLLWSFMEYTMHRFAFHHLFGPTEGKELPLHLKHHEEPTFPSYNLTPLHFSIPFTLVVWGLLRLAVGSWQRTTPIVVGAVAGYLTYELLHYAIHMRSTSGGILFRVLRRNHFIHHFKANDSCYGVTNPLWDFIFRTLPQTRRQIQF
ncbi:MAG TPA: sterol desaturase family protein [Pyrinomonadaceae bacterium]|nr:sterol desaturase family protein [Pyrinomonadaceae bacterium]